MTNISQITNYDLDNAEEETREITIDGITSSHIYKIITSNMLGSNNVFKFGYCTNDNYGLYFPIFLTINNKEKMFSINKDTGIFEFQPELWKDVNISEEEYEAAVSLSAVSVPAEIAFCIDYCYSV